MSTSRHIIRPLSPSDHDWVRQKMIEEWGAEIILVHGETFCPADLPGFVAEMEGKTAGLLTYRIQADECEVMTLNSWQTDQGVGSALLEVTRQVAKQAGCHRLHLTTTNNNLHALGFYQKRGFVISAVRINAMSESRKLKPEIPPFDEEGLPIRDEIELEMKL